MKRFLQNNFVILALLMTLLVSAAAFAADGTVTYEGAGKFTFGPGSEMSDTQLFPELEGAMPGDTLTQKVTVKNNSSESDYVKIYLRAEAHDEEENPLRSHVKDTETVASMSDFLAQLHMTVKNGEETIFDDSPEQEDGLAENVLLGKFYKGDAKDLIVTLEVPAELGNEYANRRGEVDWIFVAEELNENPHLKVTKTVTGKPENGKAYGLGETINYEITVENDGNVDLFNVEVSDELTGDAWTIEELPVGEKKTFAASYVVTEEDVIRGSVINTATAKGTPDNPDLPETPPEDDDIEVPTVKKNPHLSLTKEVTNKPKDGKAYQAGETIEYRITVKNDGNLTLTDVDVRDALTGDAWTIEKLAPGESVEYKAAYKVTADDAKKGSVENVVTATAKSADPDHEKIGPEEAKVKSKTALPKDTPKTGDDRHVWLWVTLLAVALCAACFVVILGRKKRKE